MTVVSPRETALSQRAMKPESVSNSLRIGFGPYTDASSGWSKLASVDAIAVLNESCFVRSVWRPTWIGNIVNRNNFGLTNARSLQFLGQDRHDKQDTGVIILSILFILSAFPALVVCGCLHTSQFAAS